MYIYIYIYTQYTCIHAGGRREVPLGPHGDLRAEVLGFRGAPLIICSNNSSNDNSRLIIHKTIKHSNDIYNRFMIYKIVDQSTNDNSSNNSIRFNTKHMFVIRII